MFRSKSQHSPATFEDVPIGKYAVQISKPGYVDVDAEVMVQEEKPVQLAIDLERAVTTIHLETVPSGAKVFINQDLRGVTPYDLEGPFEQVVQCAFELDGFDRHEQPLKFLDHDRSITIHLKSNERVEAALPQVAETEKNRSLKEEMLDLMDRARLIPNENWPGQRSLMLGELDQKLSDAGLGNPGVRKMVRYKIATKLQEVRGMSQDDYDSSRVQIAEGIDALIIEARQGRAGFTTRPPYQR